MKTKNWWGTLYDELLAEFLLETRTDQEKELSTRFIVDKLRLKPGDRVFDQCCGTGALSLHLALKGYQVVGMDQAEKYINAAQDIADDKKLTAEFHIGDAFEYICDEVCDGVFNWWTSFGYTMDDSYNQKMLQRASDSIKPGGYFLLDTMNISGVLRNFKPEVVNESNGVFLTRYTTIDWKQGAMLKRWVYKLPNGEEKVHETAVRLYFPHTIIDMLLDCGFQNIELFGNENGDPLTDDSLRCIVLARKSK